VVGFGFGIGIGIGLRVQWHEVLEVKVNFL